MSETIPRARRVVGWPLSIVDELARRRGDLGAAIRLRPVRWGLLGTFLLTLGSLTPAYLPQASPYWEPMRRLGLDNDLAKVFGTALVIAAVALLIKGWFDLRPTVYTGVKHWAVLAWWSLPLLAAPPIFSHDAYSYAAQGWLIHNGLNPYEVAPSVLPGTFADQVSWFWRYTPAPYGPLALQLSHGLVVLAGLNPYYSAVLMRLPALLGVFLIGHYLPRLARIIGVDPAEVAWFATINPLLIIDFVGGSHNDALMMGLVVWALYLAHRGRFLVALVLVGVAAAVKQPALLAAYPVAIIGSGWASWRVTDVARFVPRAVFALAVVVGTFAAITWASGLGYGWLNAVGVPGMIMTFAPFSMIGWGLQALVDAAGLDPTHTLAIRTSAAVGLALAAVSVIYLALTQSRTDPIRFLSWGYLAVAIFGSALHTWYLLWGGLLLPLTRPAPRVRSVAAALTAIGLVYGAANLAWRNDALALALAAIAAGLIWWVRRRQVRHEAPSHPDVKE